MKKTIYFIIITFVVFIFIHCTVNQDTGLIEVKNYTEIALTNVTIGGTLIASYVAPGGYVDYWYSQEIRGRLYTEGVKVNDDQHKTIYKLKPGYWVTIFAKKFGDGKERVVIEYSKNGTQDNNESLVDD